MHAYTEALAISCILTIRLSIDTKCFGTYCWYCIDKCCFCLKASGSNYSSVASGGKILRYCSVECMKKLNEVSPLQLSVTKPAKGFELGTNLNTGFLRLSIQGSGMLSNDEPPAITNASIILYVGKALEEVHPTSLFYYCRSHHLQTFCCCSDVSSLSEVLAMEKSVVGLDEHTKCIISLLLNFCQQHKMSVVSSSHFYSVLLKQCENASLPMASIGYCMLLPVLKMSMLDIGLISQNHETSCKSTNGDPDCVQAVKTGLVTEYQFRKLEEIVPPNCALTVEFTNQIRAVQFNDCDFICDRNFSSLVRQVCLILISRIDELLETDLKDDNKSNEPLYDNLTQLYIKIEECLEKMPIMMRQDVCDMAWKAKCFISKLYILTSMLYNGKCYACKDISLPFFAVLSGHLHS